MDKWLDSNLGVKNYGSKEYAQKQLKWLKHDLSSQIASAERMCHDEIDKILCGLNDTHDWKLESFDKFLYPLCDPPGSYRFKCDNCEEVILIPADMIDKTNFLSHVKGSLVIAKKGSQEGQS